MGGIMTIERKSIEELCRLAEALADDVLATPDEEILLQLEEDGTAAVIAATGQADVGAVKAKLGRRRLLAAKQAVATERRSSQPHHRLNVPDARRRLAAAIARTGDSNQRFTLAARAGENVPDDDVEGLVQDAEDLGINLDDTESET